MNISKSKVIKIKYAFAHSLQQYVVSKECTWDFLISYLKKARQGKKDGSGWIAAEMPDGPRKSEKVLSVSLLVFDIDNQDDTITDIDLQEKILSSGYRAVIHSTYNHSPENPRFRLILDISEPISPENHKALLLHIADNLGISDFIDKACVDSARYFYLPRCPKESLKDYIFWSSNGTPVDVSAHLELISISDETLPIPLAKEMPEPTDWKENDHNISKVKDFLNYCDANCDYQTWRDIIWSVSSLNWNSGPKILVHWSQESENHWTYDRHNQTENELNQLISSYDPKRGITIGTLVAHAKRNGWTPASPFDVFCEENNNDCEKPLTKQQYKFLTRSEILALPKLSWRVKHVLPARGVAAIYGPSGSGKTFLALDLAATICIGNDWFGKKCSPTSVVYLGLEGSVGIQQRVMGWEVERRRQLPDNFYAVFDDFDLTNVQDNYKIIAKIPIGSVLIIDTLNRASPGKDENSSSDMGVILAAAKHLEQSIQGLVILVHHTGKDQNRGLRGHSSLHAALDAAIAVRKNDKQKTKTWNLAKSKDGDDEVEFDFRLEKHFLGKDEDGEYLTSCTVEKEISTSKLELIPMPKGSQQQLVYKVLKSLIKSSPIAGKGGALPEDKCVSLNLAVNEGKDALVTVDKSKRSNRAKKIIEDLVNQEFIIAGLDEDENSWLWLPDDN